MTNMTQARRQFWADLREAQALERLTKRTKGLTDIYTLRKSLEAKVVVRAAKTILALTKGHTSNEALYMRAGLVNLLARHSVGVPVFIHELPTWFQCYEAGISDHEIADSTHYLNCL